jgi:PKD repeat protein
MYAVDPSENEVFQYTDEGTFIRSWGVFGDLPGQLNDPFGIAVDEAGSVYVSQPDLIGTNAPTVVQKFSSAGAYEDTYNFSGQPAALSYMAPNLYAADFNSVTRINLVTPIAAIAASTTTPIASQTVTFNASASSLPFGTITDYKWDLDGSGAYTTDTGTTPTASHTFTQPGITDVSVLVTGSSGQTATAEIPVDTTPSTATITGPPQILTSQSATFDASGSAIPGATISDYAWDFDGSESFTTDTGTTPTVRHVFSQPGTYRVQVRVTRSGGRMDVSSFAVTVTQAGATISGPAQTLTGQSVTFSGAGSAIPNSTITDYKWDLDGSGKYATDTGSSPTVTHTFSTTGTIKVGLRITRDDGEVDETSVPIQVLPAPPSGNVGVSIENGDYATNTPHVQLYVVWPAFVSTALVSNDGGFNAPGATTVLPVATQILWTLESGGSERLPKTVYLRFPESANPTITFTDDIILDTTRPTIQTAQLLNGSDAAVASTRHLRTYRVRLRARERLSGVSAAQISATRSGGTVVRFYAATKRGALHLLRMVKVHLPAKPRYVRVQSAAGTWSAWRRLS